jgi:hypothetical protein
VEPSPLLLKPPNGLFCQPRIMIDDECVAVSGMLGRGKRSTRRKPVPMLLCPPQIPHYLSRVRTWAAAVGSRRLTTRATAQPTSCSLFPIPLCTMYSVYLGSFLCFLRCCCVYMGYETQSHSVSCSFFIERALNVVKSLHSCH